MARKNMTPAQLKNLPQYRNKTEEELQEIAEKIQLGDFDDRVKKNIDALKEDYDLSDMTANDRLALHELARVFVILEDLTEDFRNAREEGQWKIMGSINREIHRLREDVSKFQRDLNITRKSRQDTGEHAVVEFIEDLKKRGKKFLNSRLSEIYCPNCNMLLAKLWLLYPDAENELTFACNKCGKVFKVKEIKNNKNIEVGPPF